MLQDHEGWLWITCNKGPDAREQARARISWLRDGSRRLRTIVYGAPDGLRASEFNGSSQPAGWTARDGRLWLPSIKGVVVVEPSALRPNPLPPPVVLEQVRIDRQLVFGRKAYIAGPGAGELELRYAAVTFTAPAKIRFGYRLDGFDADWRDAAIAAPRITPTCRPEGTPSGSWRPTPTACGARIAATAGSSCGRISIGGLVSPRHCPHHRPRRDDLDSRPRPAHAGARAGAHCARRRAHAGAARAGFRAPAGGSLGTGQRVALSRAVRRCAGGLPRAGHDGRLVASTGPSCACSATKAGR